MHIDDENGLYSLLQGCPVHGDERMIECKMCGAEFCAECFPNSAVCSECVGEEEDLDEEPDFEDVQDLDALIGEDAEAERIIQESDEDPPSPEDLEDDDR